MKKFLDLEQVIEVVFDLIPEDVQKQYEKIESGRTVTLKERFIKHWEENEFHHSKYTRKNDLKRMFLYCWSEYWEKYEICALDDLFI